MHQKTKYFIAVCSVVLLLVVSFFMSGQFAQGKLTLKNMKRGEMVSLLVRNVVPSVDFDEVKLYKNCFNDVKGNIYENYICYAKGWSYFNYLKNINGNFSPNIEITRAEAAILITHVIGFQWSYKNPTCVMPMDNFYSDVDLFDGSTASTAIKLMNCYGIPGIAKGGMFRPNDLFTNSDWVTWYQNILEAKNKYIRYNNQFSTFENGKKYIKDSAGYKFDEGSKFINLYIKKISKAVESLSFSNDNVAVNFEGQVTLTGYVDGPSDIGFGISFFADADSLKKLPWITGLTSGGYSTFIFENQDLAKSLLGFTLNEPAKTPHTIVIDKFNFVRAPADIPTTAHLVKLIK
ncbi:hypothetical protein KBC97_03145 [Candidatus Gracilibacteria bacterium]|nr:hypothetical protein [Candidatus Gracilibacteria bacterium]